MYIKKILLAFAAMIGASKISGDDKGSAAICQAEAKELPLCETKIILNNVHDGGYLAQRTRYKTGDCDVEYLAAPTSHSGMFLTSAAFDGELSQGDEKCKFAFHAAPKNPKGEIDSIHPEGYHLLEVEGTPCKVRGKVMGDTTHFEVTLLKGNSNDKQNTGRI